MSTPTIMWYVIFIGFLGDDPQPAYSLILDESPITTQAECAKYAEPTNVKWVRDQQVEYPDLEGHWLCAADKVGISRTEANTGWHIIWTGYEGDNDWATMALIAPKRYMTEGECYRAINIKAPVVNGKLTWERLCAEPVTGTIN